MNAPSPCGYQPHPVHDEEERHHMHHARSARRRAQIVAQGLSLSQGGTTVLERLSLTIRAGSRVAIVGENGRGKSTLLAALAGDSQTLVSGSVARQGRIGYAEQELPAHDGRTVGQAVAFAISDSLEALAALEVAAEGLAEDAAAGASAAEAYSDVLAAATALDAWDAERRVTVALEALGAETDRERPLSELSVGQRYRVRLACLLGGDAELLLLDEPTNHLDADALGFLTANLRSSPGGFAVVSHDRRLLRDVAETFVDLDPSADGAARICGGGYDGWAAQKRADRARWEQTHAAQLDTASKLREDLAAAQARLVGGWRPPKGTGKHQRATRAAGLVANAKRRQSELDAHSVEVPDPPLRFSPPDYKVEREGVLLAAEAVRCGGRLETPVSCSLRAGDRLLVRGPNGAGKSTLLAILAGRLEATDGRVLHLSGARIGLLAQESELGRGREPTKRADEAHAAAAESLGLLTAAEASRPARTLSLGQSRRLDLALVLDAKPDVLLLDEPTNHLSVALVDELAEALRWLPCAVIVSTHDRGLLEALRDWPAVDLAAREAPAARPVPAEASP